MSESAILEDAPEVSSGSRRLPAQPYLSFGFALALITCTIWAVDVTSPALAEIQDEFGLTARAAGLIVSTFFVGRLMGNFPSARLLETIGSPRTASIGGFVLMLGAITNAYSPTIEVLYFGRVLQGIGIALLVNAGLRSVMNARPGRGAAMTLNSVASTFGSVLGLLSSGYLTGNYGWRTIFTLSAALGGVLILLPIVGTQVARRKPRPASITTSVSGIIVPVRTYLVPLAINFLIFCNYSIWVILPLYAQRKFDATPEMTANLLLIITITHLASAVPVSRGIRRFGPSWVLVASVVVAVCGTVGVLLANSSWQLAFPLVLYGIGMVGAVNSAGDIVLHRGGGGSRAVASLRQTCDLGLVVGPIAAGSIADAVSYSAPFIVFPILMMIAAVGVLIPKSRESDPSLENA